MHVYAWLWPQIFCHIDVQAIQAVLMLAPGQVCHRSVQVCMSHLKMSAACCLAYKGVAVLCCAAQNLGSDFTVELRMMSVAIMTATF